MGVGVWGFLRGGGPTLMRKVDDGRIYNVMQRIRFVGIVESGCLRFWMGHA